MISVLGIIPARGGSKGIVGKNIIPLCGKPLLQYTAEAALTAKTLAAVVLSTDDPAIAEVGRACGLEVPFMRPPELAQDDTPTRPVLQDVVRKLALQDRHYDAICLLQPTNPLRRSEQIDGCVHLFEEQMADCVMTVLPVPAKHNPHWVFFGEPDGTLKWSMGIQEPITQRQLLPTAWHREGSIYVIRRSVLMEQDSLYGEKMVGYPLDPENSVNIDRAEDLAHAEQLLAQRNRLAVGL